jgi:hypothetical protein
MESMLEQKDTSSGLLSTLPVQRAIPLDSPLEWKQALAGIRHSFFHTWEYCSAMFLTTGQPTFLYCAETPEARVVCPFVERTFGDYVDIATPYGFSGFAGNGAIPDLTETWRRFAAERGYISGFISLHPLFAHADSENSPFVYEMKTLYLLNLKNSIPDLFRKCSKTLRQELNKWQRGVFVNTDREELTAFALNNYKEFFHSHKATAVYDLNPKTFEFLMGLENVVALGVGPRTGLEAVIMAGFTPYAAEAIFSFTIPGARGHGAGLVWKLAEALHKLEIPYLNLGGGRVPNDSLAFFKSRFGPEQLPLHVLKEVYAVDDYKELCLHAGVSPEDRGGYFPSYRSSQSVMVSAAKMF